MAKDLHGERFDAFRGFDFEANESHCSFKLRIRTIVQPTPRPYSHNEEPINLGPAKPFLR